MRSRIIGVLGIALTAALAHGQDKPWLHVVPAPEPPSIKILAAQEATPEVIAKAIARTPGIPMLVSTTLSPKELGTVEIVNSDESAGILPAVVSAHDGGEIKLVEYMPSGIISQTFRCLLTFTGSNPQAIVAIGDDNVEAYDVLGGVLMTTDIGYELRFDKRARLSTGVFKQELHSLSIPKGYAEILFDSQPSGATILVPSYGIVATTPATLSMKYWPGKTILAYMKRDGSFDAQVKLRFVTDNNADFMVTGDGRYLIPPTPTTPIARIVAMFESITSP
jgi:hypothetical protein